MVQGGDEHVCGGTCKHLVVGFYSGLSILGLVDGPGALSISSCSPPPCLAEVLKVYRQLQGEIPTGLSVRP